MHVCHNPYDFVTDLDFHERDFAVERPDEGSVVRLGFFVLDPLDRLDDEPVAFQLLRLFRHFCEEVGLALWT